jgi:hypothetical protein
MQYMLIQFVEPHDLADANADMASWAAYTRALVEAGVMVGGNALAGPNAATTLRMRGGRREVQDGPFADSKEQLGGYYVIEVPNLDVALDWAARSPAATTGAIEIRPILTP